jgi:hypothetical protein
MHALSELSCDDSLDIQKSRSIDTVFPSLAVTSPMQPVRDRVASNVIKYHGFIEISLVVDLP